MSNDDIAASEILRWARTAFEPIRAYRSPSDALGRTGSNILQSVPMRLRSARTDSNGRRYGMETPTSKRVGVRFCQTDATALPSSTPALPQLFPIMPPPFPQWFSHRRAAQLAWASRAETTSTIFCPADGAGDVALGEHVTDLAAGIGGGFGLSWPSSSSTVTPRACASGTRALERGACRCAPKS